MNLTKNAKIARVLNTTAGGFGDTIQSSAVDTQGYGACTFIVCFGAIAGTATAIVKAQQSSDNDADTYADLLGTGVAVTDADDDDAVLLEINAPRERYLKCAVARATANVAIDSIMAILTKPSIGPVTQPTASVIGTGLHQAPAEGTA